MIVDIDETQPCRHRPLALAARAPRGAHRRTLRAPAGRRWSDSTWCSPSRTATAAPAPGRTRRLARACLRGADSSFSPASRRAVQLYLTSAARAIAGAGLGSAPLPVAVDAPGGRTPATSASSPARRRVPASSTCCPTPTETCAAMPLVARVDGGVQATLALAMLRRQTGAPEVRPVPSSTGRSRRSTSCRAARPWRSRSMRRASCACPTAAQAARGAVPSTMSRRPTCSRAASPRAASRAASCSSARPRRGVYDLRSTPVGEVYPGVEVHASLLSGLLDGRTLVQPDWARGYEVLQLIAVAALLIARAAAPGADPVDRGDAGGGARAAWRSTSGCSAAPHLVLPLATALVAHRRRSTRSRPAGATSSRAAGGARSHACSAATCRPSSSRRWRATRQPLRHARREPRAQRDVLRHAQLHPHLGGAAAA